MSFDNGTNHNRVAKMLDQLNLIASSGKSNKATPTEMREMLDPLIETIQHVCSGADAPLAPSQEEQPVQRPVGFKSSRWADVRQMAEEAPLDELGGALAIYMNRVDDLLHQQRNGAA